MPQSERQRYACGHQQHLWRIGTKEFPAYTEKVEAGSKGLTAPYHMPHMTYLLHDLVALQAGVAINRGPVGLVAVAHDHDVVALAEGVGVDGLGVEDHLRVFAGGLVGGGAVEVPFGAGGSNSKRKNMIQVMFLNGRGKGGGATQRWWVK